MQVKSWRWLLTVVLMLVACSPMVHPSTVYPEEMPKEFDFSVEYGVDGKQKVDTFTDTVVKDLVIDGVVETSIALTDEEMQDVYNKMVALDIMGKLDFEEDENAQCASEPQLRTEWVVHLNGDLRIIRYTLLCSDTPDSQSIMHLQEYVHSLMVAKEKYQQLPESNGYYE
ncbi:hypothetical protein [Sporosarcina sp. YIM B06819]|uniref:hypothetical protein n=1 Tax=Sporosarcina sp. YIM B06819 TaxID=3081769 RepID=UPI00298D4B24|nr:hypothetical protein [Sporosarcina sp. YIM B06819]